MEQRETPDELDERWRADLSEWGIPHAIAAGARSDPWGHSPARFGERTDRALADPEGPTLARVAEALPPGGSVLDVGAGTGAASLPLARLDDAGPGTGPPPTRPSPAGTAGGAVRRDRAQESGTRLGELIAVDTSAAMLAELAARAGSLGVPVRPVTGRWPDVAGETPAADVAVAAHVVYNVPDLAAFLTALTGHARRRVVLELTHRHPMSWLSPLWARFHGLIRPERPVADDVAALARRLGYGVRQEERPAPLPRFASLEAMAESACRRLCLDPGRAEEVVAAAVELDMWPMLRDRWVTLWWDVA
ncbi:methyltransferase [Planomonospora sphaerica]|uniref:Methyltransferase n=1 Tax=Planomonospora sphaerica TaxID=161355 RepID=A0A161MER0_9ACTN|nr:class I SAM-dependent methyltransferase [Planomonospora sphaerica]GAT70553.1 methyltransferase [Planomonospora sphaerica]